MSDPSPDELELPAAILDRLVPNEGGEMNLMNIWADPTYWKAIGAKMVKQEGVKSLLMMTCGLDDDSLEVLLSTILAFKDTLVELGLGGNKLTAKGMAHLAQILPQLPNLRGLSVYRNSLGDEGVMALVDGVRQMEDLERLELSSSGVGDAGVSALLPVLAQKPGLHNLTLDRNALTDACVPALVALALDRPNLRRLHLQKNAFSEEGRTAVREAWGDRGLSHVKFE